MMEFDDSMIAIKDNKQKEEQKIETIENYAASKSMTDLLPPTSSLMSKFRRVSNMIIMVNRTSKYSQSQQRKISELPYIDRFRFVNLFFKKEPRSISNSVHLFRAFIVLLIILFSTALCIAFIIHSNLSPYYISYAAILCVVFCLFLWLDHYDNFDSFQSVFETSLNGYIQTICLISFCITAFIDYVLIGLEEDNIINGNVALITIDVLYYIALFLFFCTSMAYWKTFSFYCSEKASLHALFYLTIIGYIIICICRWLRPVAPQAAAGGDLKQSSWIKQHKLPKILSAMIKVIIFLFVFCVFLGGIGIALFAEFARQSSQFGVGFAIFGFCAVSMVIMLTPLAPGSIVDACGGFVFIQLLSDPNSGPNYSFFISWFLGILVVCILHFVGACLQWYIGKWPAIQIWANNVLPIEMLAASDAVLRDAGILKVGLVGYMFLDTANGINQGRMNLPFWTQLLSEWACIPNAIGLVSLGATIAAQALKLDNMDWTIIAVPLFLLFSTLVQAAGGTFGARAMGNSTDTVRYWTAREKWTMVQFFHDIGYSPTIEGWKNDVFNLSKVNDLKKEKFGTQLFEAVAPLHFAYVQNRKETKDAEERIKIFEKYRNALSQVREMHYSHFETVKADYLECGWLIYKEPKTISNGFFYCVDEKLPKWKIRLWIVLCVIALAAFWGCFYGIYMQSSLQDAVSYGISTLYDVTIPAWSSAFVFLAVITFVYHVEIINSLCSCCSTFGWMITGCRINRNIETRFLTPAWNVPNELNI